ncbi:MAG: hypothetical protein AAAB35_04910 [Phyllobacterium sp.]|uniref:hypothetical protein n=1 Tax=Phyllobacterium sp. TaxID=1871046 RepID=UPI0030F350E7
MISHSTSGQIGVETVRNLSHNGNCWIADQALVLGQALVSGDALVGGHARVSGAAYICRSAIITDYA